MITIKKKGTGTKGDDEKYATLAYVGNPKIMERLRKGFMPGNTWKLLVWIEDVEEGKEVSTVERNL